MPAVKTTSLGMKTSFSPYSMNYTSRLDKVAPFSRLRTPYIDIPHISNDLLPYDGLDESQFSLTQWMSAGPLFTESDIYDSLPCPPSFNVGSTPSGDNLEFDEILEGNAYTWSYNNNTGYDASFSSLPEPSTAFSNTFSPTISVVSCSPRSEHSGLSLSPQPNTSEFSTVFNFDYTTSLPHEFPSSSSSPWSSPSLNTAHSPQSTTSHSPSPSCSSLDVDVKRPRSKSRDSSPSQTDKEARRRFPCLILGCERRFTSQYTLKVHMEAHKPKPRTSFPCTLGCAERFSRQHDRLRHEVAKHGKVCEFLCDDCGRFFSSKKTLGNHKCPVAQGSTRWVSN